MRSHLMPLWMLFLAYKASARSSSGINGPLLPGSADTPEQFQFWEQAGRRPNASTSVDFTRLFNGSQETWTWRVNVTDLGVPDNRNDIGSSAATFSRGDRVTNVQYELGWPQGAANENGTIQSFLQPRNMNLSIAALAANLPSNVTDRYRESDNGNCGPVLGDQCVQAIQSAATRNTDLASNVITSMPECQDTLGIRSVISDGFRTTIPANSSVLYNRTETLYFSTSPTYSTGNLTRYNESVSALQVLIIIPDYDTTLSQDPRGASDGASLTCRIVDSEVKTPSATGAANWLAPNAALSGLLLLGLAFIL